MNIQSKKTLVLTQRDIEKIVAQYGLNAVMDTLVSRLIATIGIYDSEKTVIPMRSGFNYETPNTGLVEWMPVYNTGQNVIIKLVGYHPRNPDKYGLPTILSTISGYDTATGHLFGLMDGVFLTALRTAAASAVASKYLAHPSSTTLGLIGCGAQAVTQLHSLSRIFDIQKVLIYDVDINTVMSFSGRCEILGLDLEIIPSNMEEVVEQADILCTATSIEAGGGPLFDNVETKAHLHINAIGSDFPGKTELPLSILEQSFICPDFIAQARVEGECQQIQPEQINADLTQVVKNPSTYTAVQNQRSVFDSTGWALEDSIVMGLFMDYAKELGLGHEMEIEIVTEDAKNPYGFVKASKQAILSAPQG